MSTTNTSTPLPGLLITNVEYLQSEYDPEQVRYLLPNSLFGIGENRIKTVEEALEIIFRQCNHVDGSELISSEAFRASYPGSIRSLSVGDVVSFRGIGGFRKIYVCEGTGWAEITSKEASWLLKHITPRDFWGTFAETVNRSNLD